MILILPIACAAGLAACGSGGKSTAGASEASGEQRSPALQAAAEACGVP